MSYDLAVTIGRFQPPHAAHLANIRHALSLAPRVTVIIGSHHVARTPKNPWTSAERIEMIAACLTEAERARVSFHAVQDWRYDDNLWVASVQREVQGLASAEAKLALVGHPKDASSYYLSLFPDWDFIAAPVVADLNATDLRHAYLTDPEALDRNEALPACVRDWLRAWKRTPEYAQLAEEWRFILDYRARWAAAPYPVNFVTADAVVVKSGHVLLVERKHAPGKGLWALPGGFVDTHERVLDAALRELQEETRLQVPEAELRIHLMAQRVFDDPSRSLRSRTITHAFCFHLGGGPLPRTEASDDAARAFWLPLTEVPGAGDRFFDDHKDIVAHFTHRF